MSQITVTPKSLAKATLTVKPDGTHLLNIPATASRPAIVLGIAELLKHIPLHIVGRNTKPTCATIELHILPEYAVAVWGEGPGAKDLIAAHLDLTQEQKGQAALAYGAAADAAAIV